MFKIGKSNCPFSVGFLEKHIEIYRFVFEAADTKVIAMNLQQLGAGNGSEKKGFGGYALTRTGDPIIMSDVL